MIELRKPNEEFSFEEYLAWEEPQQERHEYVGGVAYAMTGGIQAHHVITANALAELRRLFGDRCLVFSQGFKVRIRRIKDERGYYPDVFVTCRPGESGSLFNEEPCLIVEVLSESTRRIDLGEKLDAYSSVSSRKPIWCSNRTGPWSACSAARRDGQRKWSSDSTSPCPFDAKHMRRQSL